MTTVASPGQPGRRAYAGGYFHLELDGQEAGVLAAVDGGHLKSEAIGEQVGGENLVTRYPGRQKIEDVTVQIGGKMTSGFWTWLNDSLKNKPSRRNGAIVSRDFNHRERGRRTFYDALISEIQFPQLDASAKQAKLISIKFSPERLSYDEDRAGQTGDTRVDAVSQKKSLPMNFRFRIDGIPETACRRVSTIEGFSIKQNIINNPVGGLLFARKEAGRVEFPTISFSVPEIDIQPWNQWWKEFVAEGNHTQKKERTGEIAYLDSTLQETLLHLDLAGVGITGITFDKLEAGSEKIHRAKIDLYVESIALKVSK